MYTCMCPAIPVLEVVNTTQYLWGRVPLIGYIPCAAPDPQVLGGSTHHAVYTDKGGLDLIHGFWYGRYKDAVTADPSNGMAHFYIG